MSLENTSSMNSRTFSLLIYFINFWTLSIGSSGSRSWRPRSTLITRQGGDVVMNAPQNHRFIFSCQKLFNSNMKNMVEFRREKVEERNIIKLNLKKSLFSRSFCTVQEIIIQLYYNNINISCPVSFISLQTLDDNTENLTPSQMIKWFKYCTSREHKWFNRAHGKRKFSIILMARQYLQGIGKRDINLT